MTTVAVMQPHYLPWPGYFALLDRADVFVILDTVAVSKQSWQTRNRIRGRDGNIVWLSVPTHAHEGQPLSEVAIDNTKPWQRKHWRTIESAYGKAPYWDNIADRLGWIYDQEWTTLTKLTASLIADIAGYLYSPTRRELASSLGSTRAGKLERLTDICRHTGATSYLTVPGATYLDELDELAPGIPIERYRYQPAEYPQGGMEWQPNLSIVDLLAYHGPDSLDILRRP